MTLNVRRARSSDVNCITDFNARMAMETERKKLDLNVLRRGVTAVISDPAKGMYYVAEFAGEVVGQTLVTYEWSDWRNGTFWWIQSVYVPEQWRGKKGVRDIVQTHRADGTVGPGGVWTSTIRRKAQRPGAGNV